MDHHKENSHQQKGKISHLVSNLKMKENLRLKVKGRGRKMLVG
jgi:hypothetical protein